MSSSILEPVAVPLVQDTSGALRVGNTRVLLELIVRAFRAGATPEEIVQAYDVLKLRDVYSVLAWCLNNEQVVTEYMRLQEMKAAVQKELLTVLQPNNADLLSSLRARAAAVGE